MRPRRRIRWRAPARCCRAPLPRCPDLGARGSCLPTPSRCGAAFRLRCPPVAGCLRSAADRAQLREVREGLAVARTECQRAKKGGLGFVQAAEAVQGQAGAVGGLAVVGALLLYSTWPGLASLAGRKQYPSPSERRRPSPRSHDSTPPRGAPCCGALCRLKADRNRLIGSSSPLTRARDV